MELTSPQLELRRLVPLGNNSRAHHLIDQTMPSEGKNDFSLGATGVMRYSDENPSLARLARCPHDICDGGESWSATTTGISAV